MRVLLVSDFYPPAMGGAERQTQLLGHEMVLRGHRVGVATLWQTGLPEHQVDSGVDVFRVKGLTTRLSAFFRDPDRRRFHPPFPDPGVVSALRRVVDSFGPDIVQAAGWISYSCAVALWRRCIPLLLSVRDYGYSCPKRTLLHEGRACTGPQFSKCLLCAGKDYGAIKAAAATTGVFGGRKLLTKKINGVHSISSYVRMTIHRDLLDGMTSKSNPCDRLIDTVIASFLEDEPNPEACSGIATGNVPVGVPAEPFILYVGAIQSHKGVDILLEAYEGLKAPPPLVLVGTSWGQIPSRLPPNVTLLSDIPHHVVMQIWRRCLFGVAPSVWPEPLGAVVFEAMSRGKAMIGTSPGGHSDMIVDGVTGSLVRAGDVAGLRTAMEILISDEMLRDRMGQAALRRASDYSAASVVPLFEALYQDLVMQKPYLG